MAFRSHSSTHRLICGTAAVAALSLATVACSSAEGEAQAARTRGGAVPRVNQSGYSAEFYPLDEDTVRKVVAVMRAWTPPEPTSKSFHEKIEGPDQLSAEEAGSILAARWDAIEKTFLPVVRRDLMADSTATIDGTPALKAAIASQGLSSRRFAEAMLAYHATLANIDVGDLLNAEFGKSEVLVKNRALIRRMRASEGGELPSWWWR